ncbi:2-amino-4-hydroxy-6-hydroxymethyldihydropteridine diphosphokinase [Weissella minor]|uniref:2-amino-4-hydroxy-6- hydroxymethyldihydropteridine diphosphokinase n=1 Tax=Weissella minor TaxID=1620 RepID=UPI003AF1FC34
MKNTSYIGLGSNMGKSLDTIKQVIKDLNTSNQISVDQVSNFYITAPVGNIDQDQFTNAVIKITTTLSAEQLLTTLQALEHKYHRVRTIHWGPRTLDLDIELFNNDSIQSDRLDVPHREMFNRLFVLVPLLDVLDVNHPQYQKVITRTHDLRGTQYIEPLN